MSTGIRPTVNHHRLRSPFRDACGGLGFLVITAFILAIGPLAATAQPKPTLLMFPARVNGLTLAPVEKSDIEQTLVFRLGSEGIYVMMSRSQVQEELGPNVTKKFLGCTGTACRRSLARMAVADMALGVELKKNGSICQVSASVEDVWRDRPPVNGSVDCGCSSSELRACMEPLAGILSGRKPVLPVVKVDPVQPAKPEPAQAAKAEPAQTAKAQAPQPASPTRTGPAGVDEKATRPVTTVVAGAAIDETGFITVLTTPPGAMVIIDGKEKGRSPYQDELSVGRHQVQAKIDDYYHVATTDIVLDAGGLSINLDVLPAYGTLEIVSSEPGAQVIIDGKLFGKTPFKSEKFRSGKHAVEVTMPRYKSVKRDVVVSDGKSTTESFSLAQRFGKMALSSNPTGAQVLLDGKPVGKTPMIVQDVEEGEHTLKFTKPMYDSHEEKVTFKGGETIPYNVDMMPDFGSISVTSNPPGGTVFVDGVDAGVRTPGMLESVKSGEHKLTVRLAGHIDATKTIAVGKGQALDAGFELVPRLGVLSVMAQNFDGTPCYGNLKIDRERKGVTPWKGSILAVPHLVEVFCGEARAMQTVEVVENSRTTLVLKMTEASSSVAEAEEVPSEPHASRASASVAAHAAVPARAVVADPDDEIEGETPVDEPIEEAVVESDDVPVYKKWWLWTILGIAVAGAAAGTAAGLLLDGPDMLSGTVSR